MRDLGGCLSICLQETSLALGTANKQTQTLLAQTIIANSLPHMELDDSSMSSTPPEKEPVMECSLMLTTLSGVTFQVSLSVAKFDRFEDLEDQVMDYLVSVTDLKVFGCSIDFLQTATQTYQEDPIWDKLQQGMGFFPRVQTPCGHGAQVIVGGREERQMVENGTKTPKNQPKTKHPSPQADSTIL